MSTPEPSPTFAGIPAGALSFYAELEDVNSRDWWLAHKDVYERDVREPMLALLDALEDEFGAAKLFRPNRDVRFSADKSPYKTHQGALVGAGTVQAYYVQVSAEGVGGGGGFRAEAPPARPGSGRRSTRPRAASRSRPSCRPCATRTSTSSGTRSGRHRGGMPPTTRASRRSGARS